MRRRKLISTEKAVHSLTEVPARLFADAAGIDHVFVNGREIVRGTDLTGAFPGKILRPGVDTDTVSIPASA